jgi:hypothetical protein
VELVADEIRSLTRQLESRDRLPHHGKHASLRSESAVVVRNFRSISADALLI